MNTKSSIERFSTQSRVQELQDENDQLRQQYDELKTLYENLMNEEKHSTDYRRVLLLKSKNIQLERQVQLLIAAADLRADFVNQVENYALELKESITEGDGDDKKLVKKSEIDVEFISRWATSVVTKVKQYQIYSKQAEHQKYYMSTEFSGSDSLSVQEMCQGKNQDLAYMDLTKISSLEDKIANLYLNLIRLHTSLKGSMDPKSNSFENTIKMKAMNNISEAVSVIGTMAADLVDMSVVVPSKINYGAKPDAIDEVDFNRERLTDYDLSLSTNGILSRLPTFSKNRAECEKGIRSLVRAFHVQKNIWEIEKKILTEEMDFYKRCHEFQMGYSRSMIKEIDQAIGDFKKSLGPITSSRDTKARSTTPILDILQSFSIFDDESSEENLRHLLKTISTIYNNFDPDEEKEEMESNRKLQFCLEQDYNKFKRELDAIQHEYNLKQENLLGSKFKYEEDLLKLEMFMSEQPQKTSQKPSKSKVTRPPSSSTKNASTSRVSTARSRLRSN